MEPNAGEIKLLELLQVRLKAASETVATAESCTGGMLAAWLTALPGSSDIYLGGVSAYANSVKEHLLGVSPQDLSRKGAVSAEVAESMARGCAERIGATYGISLTGIAGPGGATAGKPVGTVYCGFYKYSVEGSGEGGGAEGTEVVHQRWLFSGSREEIRRQATSASLQLLALLSDRFTGSLADRLRSDPGLKKASF